jgi:hypothetical protein
MTIIKEKLTKGSVRSIKSAIVILDGTSLFYNSEYTGLKNKFEAGEISAKQFGKACLPLYKREFDVRALIADGRTEDALALLTQYSDDALLLQVRFDNGKKQYNMGLIEFSEWQRTQAQINYYALQLVSNLGL